MHDTDAPAPYLLHNGELIDPTLPVVSISNGALLYGQGIFETLAVYHGIPFAAEAHYKRLSRGASQLSLKIPSLTELMENVDRIVKANQLCQFEKSRLRITVTTEGCSITTSTILSHSESAKVTTVPFVRNERGALAGLKTVNYGENVVAMRHAHEAGADESLFGNTRDNLCEGTWSNIFVLARDQWITPPLDSGCLPGVTREILLNLAGTGHPRIEEANLPLSDLDQVEAAFLTSSIREIQPVTAINGRMIDSLNRPEIDHWMRAYREFVITKE
tara:strand:- start:67 stop:891 length:825 start_codon:yes stop_codon:yes gene_type:complete